MFRNPSPQQSLPSPPFLSPARSPVPGDWSRALAVNNLACHAEALTSSLNSLSPGYCFLPPNTDRRHPTHSTCPVPSRSFPVAEEARFPGPFYEDSSSPVLSSQTGPHRGDKDLADEGMQALSQAEGPRSRAGSAPTPPPAAPQRRIPMPEVLKSTRRTPCAHSWMSSSYLVSNCCVPSPGIRQTQPLPCLSESCS